MNSKFLMVNGGKIITIGGLAFVAFTLLHYVVPVIAIVTLGSLILYGKSIISTVGNYGFYIDRIIEKAIMMINPVLVMEKHIHVLRKKRRDAFNKMTSIKGKVNVLNEKISNLKKINNEKVEPAIEALGKSVEYLELHHEKLNGLSAILEEKVKTIESDLEVRSLTHSAMKEALSVAKMSKEMIDSEHDNRSEGKNVSCQIDYSISKMRGEMEELIRQVNEELSIKM